jgi:flagellar hook-basal body complex protein FliE
MVNKVGGGMAREAILAAMRTQQEAARGLANPGMSGSPGLGGPAGAQGVGLPGVGEVGAAGSIGSLGGASPTGFVEALKEGLGEVSQKVQAAESLPEAVVKGEIDEFHDVALTLKQSDLSFRFALQVRNKLIDAYREVMRMSV